MPWSYRMTDSIRMPPGSGTYPGYDGVRHPAAEFSDWTGAPPTTVSQPEASVPGGVMVEMKASEDADSVFEGAQSEWGALHRPGLLLPLVRECS